MYDFTQDFTEYQKLVPNADLTVKPPSTGTTQPQGYDFNKDLEGYRKIAPDMSGLESVNDPLIKKAKLAQEKQQEEDKNKLKLAADLMITSGYSPDPEGVASAQITEGARKSLAGMQDRILGKSGVITQRFGNKNPIEKFSGGVNYGTDIGVDRGTKVSVPPGKWKVMEAYSGAEEGKQATNRGYGNSILVQNQETGEKMRFSHLSQVGVKPGEIVDGNKIVGATGSTGNSTGPHLDLEMYDRSGRLIDILNTPYSSYLGLGQGGGSTNGEGGGNPSFDNMLKVGRQALESGVPLLQVPQKAKEFLYNPETKRIAPSSPMWELNDISNIQDPNERRRRLIDWSSNMSMALSTGKAPETSYIKGEEQGVRNILGGVHNPGAPSEKGIFNVIIKDAKGNKIGNRIYEDSVSAQRAIERIALEPNHQALVQKLDVMPGPDGLAPLDVKKAKIGKEMIKPSTGGENPLIQEARKYKSAEEFANTLKENPYTKTTSVPMDIQVSKLKPNETLLTIKKNSKVISDPISVVYDVGTGEYRVTDGHHRLAQAIANGQENIPTRTTFTKNNEGNVLTKSQLTDIYNQSPSTGGEIGGTTVYHGAREKIDKFDLNHLNATYMHDGLGVNFTDNKDFAKLYSRGKNQWGEINKLDDGKGFVNERILSKDARILDVTDKSKKVSDVLSIDDFKKIANLGRDKEFARKNLERMARNSDTMGNLDSLSINNKVSKMSNDELLDLAYSRLKDKTFANGDGLPDVFRQFIDVYGIKKEDLSDVVTQFAKNTGIDVIKTKKPDGSNVFTVLNIEKLKPSSGKIPKGVKK